MTKPLALIIEDDPTLGEIFSITLESDFETETIKDGPTAITYLAGVVPALVILDLHLPGLSGADILSRIRGDERLSKTRVILATADNQRANLIETQADMVLLKPISPTQLRELARRLKP
jgi:Response regulators consisting of a CheY-like receiver domain and a winged-helix DNA-binding domain